MSEPISCKCPDCGAKYRLPAEVQGRSVRCKKCQSKFKVPKRDNLEDSILDWLTEADPEEETTTYEPRVISMPDEGDDEATSEKIRQSRFIRQKSAGSAEQNGH